jgi:hypothetical protein
LALAAAYLRRHLASFLRFSPEIHRSRADRCETIILEHAMKHRRHIDTSELAQREAVQIRKTVRKMISDITRTVQLLNCDITTEEQRAGISDRSDAAYPILARMLATRRDNLKDTITALEQRLSKLDQAQLVAQFEIDYEHAFGNIKGANAGHL